MLRVGRVRVCKHPAVGTCSDAAPSVLGSLISCWVHPWGRNVTYTQASKQLASKILKISPRLSTRSLENGPHLMPDFFSHVFFKRQREACTHGWQCAGNDL